MITILFCGWANRQSSPYKTKSIRYACWLLASQSSVCVVQLVFNPETLCVLKSHTKSLQPRLLCLLSQLNPN
jgi:hypothetical protein